MTPQDPRLLSIITHDLRNGLNAINMTLHMIQGELPTDGNPELRSDFEMLQESVASMRNMLNGLNDYAQLFENRQPPVPLPFSPKRLISDVVQDLSESARAELPIRVEIRQDCPEVVELDPGRAHAALRHAIANALASGEGGEVEVTASGRGERWSIAIRDPSPLALANGDRDLRSDRMERLLSNRRERRGMDLAIVAAVSSQFGGQARLEPISGGGTELILDWPTRLPAR